MARYFRRKKQFAYSHGFTLIELLVVISIIALLLAVLMPALGRAQDQVRAVVCKSNLKQIGIASDMYSIANDQKMVFFQRVNSSGDPFIWANDIEPYLGGKGESFSKNLTNNSETLKKTLSVFRCPAQREKLLEDKGGSGLLPTGLSWRIRYGINLYCSSMWADNTNTKPLYKVKTQFKSPGGRMFIADSTDNTNKYIDEHVAAGMDVWRDVPAWRHFLTQAFFESTYYVPIADRHSGDSNLLFLDGHVGAMNYKDVQWLINDSDRERAFKKYLWNWHVTQAW